MKGNTIYTFLMNKKSLTFCKKMLSKHEHKLTSLNQNKLRKRKRINQIKQKQQRSNFFSHQAKATQLMTYNVIDDLSKLKINFPFMEVVKIPKKRKNCQEYLMIKI
jgi:hypothetical protein